MHQVNLSDSLFEQAQRRAAEGGYSTVDDYVAELVGHDALETENLDHLFTPERLAIIERASAEIEAGQVYTAEQADQQLAERGGDGFAQIIASPEARRDGDPRSGGDLAMERPALQPGPR